MHLEKVKKAKEAFLKKVLKNVIITINFSRKIIFIYEIYWRTQFTGAHALQAHNVTGAQSSYDMTICLLVNYVHL